MILESLARWNATVAARLDLANVESAQPPPADLMIREFNEARGLNKTHIRRRF
jgi:hypothetical protein